MKAFFADLHAHAKSLSNRRLLRNCALASLPLSLGLLGLSALDALVPLREAYAAFAVVLLTAMGTALLILAILTAPRHALLSSHDLAKRLEAAFPTLNDALITASAILSQKPNGPLSALESHVIDHSAKAITRLPWQSAATQRLESRAVVSTAAALAIVLLGLGAIGRPVTKSGFFISDALTGQFTGITVGPRPLESPRGADFSLSVTVHRWEHSAQIHVQSATDAFTETIVLDPSGRGTFTLFSVEQPLRIFITTPSLRSPTFAVRPFDPPSFDDLELRITPPSYTGIEPTIIPNLADLTVPEGSDVHLRMPNAPSGLTGELRTPGSVFPLAVSPSDPAFAARFTAQSSTTFNLWLRSADKRTALSPTHNLTVIPDKPPAVEILQPTNDSVLAPDDSFPLEVFAADDYQLAAVNVVASLSGQQVGEFQLPIDPASTDAQSWSQFVDLPDIEAVDGDLLVLYAEALDNREPFANRTRSDLVFVEIRAPKPPVEMDGMPMERTELDLRVLIAEGKRLMRESHRMLALPPDQHPALAPPIRDDLFALATEIQSTFDAVRPDLEDAALADIIGAFESAIAQARIAGDALLTDNPRQSLPIQENALSQLLRIENALRQNIISNSPQSPNESESSGQGQGQGQSKEQSTEPAPDAQSLADALANLQQRMAEQNALNSTFNAAQNSGWDPQAAADAQSANAAATMQLRSALANSPETEAARAPLAEAARQMRNATEAAQADDPAAALRAGLRAIDALSAAQRALEAAQATAGQQQMAAAQAAANALAQAQQQAAEASTQAAANPDTSPEALAALEANQRQLNSQFDALLDALNQQANSLQSSDPQAAQALREAAANAANQPTASRMERAANALLYGQSSSAANLQSQAAADLRQFAQGLADRSANIAADPTRRAEQIARELAATREELEAYAQAPEAAPQDRLADIAAQWYQRLDELASLTGDPRFSQLAAGIASVEPSDPAAALSTSRAILGQSAAALFDFLRAQSITQDLNLNREAAPPPDRYREQVERYFRQLADEPEPSQP